MAEPSAKFVSPTTFWSMISFILVIGGIYVGLLESRFHGLDESLGQHSALPIHLQAESKIAVLDSRAGRLELDVRNHNEQFSLIKHMITEHDKATHALLGEFFDGKKK